MAVRGGRRRRSSAAAGHSRRSTGKRDALTQRAAGGPILGADTAAKIALAGRWRERKGRGVSRVANVMTPFPYAVGSHEDLRTAHAMMRTHGIRHLPVMRDGSLVGIVSARELEVAIELVSERDPEVQLPVWAVCKPDPYTVDIETPIADVADAMANQQMGSVLVTRKGKLAGIITTVDICRAFAELVRKVPPPPDEPA
jgi:acetoin utilization protein AcuB